jgi:hypothetical protein
MTIHTARRSTVLAALAIAGLFAATTAFRPAERLGHRVPRHDTAVLKVDNEGFTDRVVYIVTESGIRQRLGTATAASTTTITIPWMFIHGGSYVWFAARRFPGFTYDWSTQTFLSPGDTVRMMIQSGIGALEVASVTGGD